MIKCNLAILMAERELKMVDITEKTGIAKATLRALYHNSGKGIQYETLDTLCDFLGVTPGDLFIRVNFKMRIINKREISLNSYEIELEFNIDDEIFNEIIEVECSDNADKKELKLNIKLPKRAYERIKIAPRYHVTKEFESLFSDIMYKHLKEQHSNGVLFEYIRK